MNHGRFSEQLVVEIASLGFLKDFVFPNPHYRKGDRRLEFADALVIAGDTLIVFQVKSHISRSDSPFDLDRTQRKVEEGFRQFRAILEATKDADLNELQNSRGITVPFNIRSFKTIFLVVVLNVIRDDDTPVHCRCGDWSLENIPIVSTALEVRDFHFLARQFDTIPDFTTALGCWALICRHKDVLAHLGLAEFCASLRLYPDEWIIFAEQGKPLPDLGPEVVPKWLSEWKDSDEDESYLVDMMLEQLHSAIGLTLDLPESIQTKLRGAPDAACTYWQVATLLAMFPRRERQVLGQLLLRKREQARKDDFAYAAIRGGVQNVVIHVSHSSHVDRISELGGLCLARLASTEAETVLGISTGIDKFPFGGFQFIYLRREWIGDIEGLKRRFADQPVFARAHDDILQRPPVRQ
jgi:hypothetical protein